MLKIALESVLPTQCIMFHLTNYLVRSNPGKTVIFPIKVFSVDSCTSDHTTLYPETGYFVSGNRRLCCRFWQQRHLFPDTKYPVSGTSVDRPLRGVTSH